MQKFGLGFKLFYDKYIYTLEDLKWDKTPLKINKVCPSQSV
jgi:hypothetical protein